MAELKPCPFCGGKAEIAFIGSTNCNGTTKGYIAARCRLCGARTKGAFYKGEEITVLLESTIGGELTEEAWNQRADNG